MDANRFFTHSLRDPRVTRILAAALDAVEPGELVRKYLFNISLPKHKRIYLLGIGKASEAMTFAAAEIFRNRPSTSLRTKSSALRTKDSALKMKGSALSVVEAPYQTGLVITKHASGRTLKQVAVIEGGHPIPDERSVQAGEAALKYVSSLNEDDLLICLISGGGSALMTAPQEGISLADIQSLTRELLACGASIDEINLLRSKLDRVKGGGLAKATKAEIISLILSDVLGNPLEIITSGPTVVNSKTNSDAIKILEKYDLLEKVPVSIMKLLKSDSLPPAQPRAVQNIIIGDIHTAMQAAQRQAQAEGFDSEITNDNLHGEASEAGSELARRLKEEKQKRDRPFCLIAGGETTVTLRCGSGRISDGKGGRNQELALSAVDELDAVENILFISLATDGDDGPTDAGGAVVNGETRQRAKRLGMSAADYLSRNDAYHFFQPLNDLIKCGYTGTNVNDVVFLFGF
jgi:glycerate 2-kinase